MTVAIAGPPPTSVGVPTGDRTVATLVPTAPAPAPPAVPVVHTAGRRRGQGAAAPGGGRGAPGSTLTGGIPGQAAPWAWRPLSGPGLLSRLRNTGRRRPAADPELIAALWALVDEAAGPSGHPTDLSPDGPPAVLTGDRVAAASACPVHAPPRPLPGPPPEPSSALACGALVAAAFRQLVVVGEVGDPVEDGLAALELDDFQVALAAWIRCLPSAEAQELRSEVERQVDGLRRRWPALAPSWMPRPGLPLRIPVSGGRVLLSGRVDLAIGRPTRTEASVALVEVATGTRRSRHADHRAWLALLEAFRSGVPPFVVATYFTRTGELDTDAVDDALLVTAARRVALAVGAVTGAGDPDPGSTSGPAVTARRAFDCPDCLRDGLRSWPSAGPGGAVVSPVPAVSPTVDGGDRGTR